MWKINFRVWVDQDCLSLNVPKMVQIDHRESIVAFVALPRAQPCPSLPVGMIRAEQEGFLRPPRLVILVTLRRGERKE